MAVDIGIRIKADNMTGRDFDRLIGDLKKTGATTEQVNRSAQGFGNRLTDMRTQLRNTALGAGAVTAALGLVGRNFVQAAVKMEGYRNGLIALEGSAAEADTRLNSLREIIQLPGVSYAGAIQAAVRLRTVGFEAELANRTITEFGNALALVGSTDLSGALLGFQQIISRGRVSQEELNQLTERSGLFAAALKDAFGSIQSEQIQARLDAAGQSVTDFAEIFVSQLETLDRVAADSAANSIQNLNNAVFELRASLGEVLLPTVTSVVQILTDGINAFNEMDDSMKTAVVTVGAIATGLAALTTVAAGTGAALGGINSLLVTTTGASGFAGLAALVAPAGPLLAGLGLLSVALLPVIKNLKDAAEAARIAREQEELFANQLQKTASVLETGTGLDTRIKELQEYIHTLDDVIRKERERRFDVDNRGGNVDTILGADDLIRNIETDAISNRASANTILLTLQRIQNGTELTIDQLREFDAVVARTLYKARQSGNESLVTTLEAAAESVVTQFERFGPVVAKTSREAAVLFRHFKLELVDLNAALSESEDRFSNITDASELESATQSRLSALDAVNRVSREQIESQIAVEGAALSRLSNQERAESEHAEKIRELAVQLRQLQVDYEQEKTRITREEVEKRTEINARATQLRIDDAKREAAARLKSHQEVFGEIARTFREYEDTGKRDRTYSIFGGLLAQGVAPREALEQARDFISLTDGMTSGIRNLETRIKVFAALFRRDFTRSVQSGARLIGNINNILRAPARAALAERNSIADSLLRLEDGQAARDQRTADRFTAGLDALRQQEQRDSDAARDFVRRLRRAQPFSGERLTEDTGDLVSAVPIDVVEAVTNSIQLRRDASAEIVQLEQETAAEIQLIQESLTLSAENKAKAIERIERQSALERIRIENDVSQRQRASFQSVVSNFLSGVAQMIAAEAQLALARRATDALGGLFGGGAAAAGAGLLGGVALPLLGSLGLAYGASQLVANSTPSVEVHQRLAAGRGSDTPTLEANISVNVEASGTRLGQANERVRLKTERWGG